LGRETRATTGFDLAQFEIDSCAIVGKSVDAYALGEIYVLRLLVAAILAMPLLAAGTVESSATTSHHAAQGIASDCHHGCDDEPGTRSCMSACLVSCVTAIPSGVAALSIETDRHVVSVPWATRPRGSCPATDTPPPKRLI
jgi:hypothetical protein